MHLRSRVEAPFGKPPDRPAQHGVEHWSGEDRFSLVLARILRLQLAQVREKEPMTGQKGVSSGSILSVLEGEGIGWPYFSLANSRVSHRTTPACPLRERIRAVGHTATFNRWFHHTNRKQLRIEIMFLSHTAYQLSCVSRPASISRRNRRPEIDARAECGFDRQPWTSNFRLAKSLSCA